MYVCVCNAVTEKQVRAAVQEGVYSLRELSAKLGVATCCGCCAKLASQIVDEELQQDEGRAGIYSAA